MTARDDQRPVHATTGNGTRTLTHRQQHDPTSPDTPDDTTTAQPAPLPKTQPLASYIRHVVDTAPRPTAEQLARLASLLRNTGDDPDKPS